MNNFKNLYNNLSKKQKIISIIIIQTIIIILFIFSISNIFQNHNHIEIENNELSEVPNEEISLFKDSLWEIISQNIDNLDKSIIDDVKIRGDSIKNEEYKLDDNSTKKQKSFIIDIDSIKQTYQVYLSWSNDIFIIPTIVCPPQSEMKYPETICYGMYNNTYSLDLYLPYLIYPEDDDNNEYAPNIMIFGDEISKEINIEVSACDPDKYKQQALDYLNTTPIKLDEYNIEYKINNIDISC